MGQTDVSAVRNMVNTYGVEKTMAKLAEQGMSKEQINDLTKRCHDDVCKLAGINPSENIYPPFFDNNKRIDYYTNEYGKGYKGSW